jgi:hypothetical protein
MAGQSKPFGKIGTEKIPALLFWEDPEDSKNFE